MTPEELEARVLQLEARLLVEPRAVAPITIGELADVPAPGSPIASQWSQEVTRRSLHRFATVAARDAAYPAASAGPGAQCVTLDTYTEWLSSGTAWIPIVAGLGEVAYSAQPTPIGPFGPGISDIAGLSVTFTAAGIGAKYELLASVMLATGNASNTNMTLYITDAGNSVINARQHTILAGSYGHFTVIGRVTPGGGSVTYKVRADANAGSITANANSNTGIIRAHRIG